MSGIKKQIKSETISYIDFSDDECEKLGISENDKFSVSINDDGSILLKKHENIEIDLDDFSKEELMDIISVCNEKNITFEEFVEESLRTVVEDLKGDK
jgi:hypothetical protein